MQTAASSLECFCIYGRVLARKPRFTSLTVDDEAALRDLPPVSSEARVVLTRDTTPSGADLRHI